MPLQHGDFLRGLTEICFRRSMRDSRALSPAGGLSRQSPNFQNPWGVAIRGAPAQFDLERSVACEEMIQVSEKWDRSIGSCRAARRNHGLHGTSIWKDEVPCGDARVCIVRVQKEVR